MWSVSYENCCALGVFERAMNFEADHLVCLRIFVTRKKQA